MIEGPSAERTSVPVEDAELSGSTSLPPASTPPVVSGRGGRLRQIQTFRSLRHRDFRLLVTSTLFSSTGNWVEQVTVGWLTYELTGSAFLLGAVHGVRSLPLLLLAPFGGVAADRIEPKRLILTTQFILMITTAGFATLLATGQVQVWLLFVFPLLTGLNWAFNHPVRQSVIPSMVPRTDLLNALALSSAAFNVTRVAGPTIAGILIATTGPAENFYLQSLAYLGVAAMILRISLPKLPRSDNRSVGANLKEGVGFVWRHPTLRTQMTMAFVPVMLAFPYISLMPVFARDVLDQGPGGLGLLMGAQGAGAVAGTMIIASVRNVEWKGRFLMVAIFTLGVVLMLFSSSRSFPLSLLLMVFAGGVQVAYNTMNQTLVQLSTPDALRGRVMGLYMLEQGVQPFGSLLAGTLAGLADAPTAVFIMGLLVSLLTVAFAVRARALRELRV